MDIRDLTFVAEKQPAAGEDQFQLFLVDILRAKYAAVEKSLLGVRDRVCCARHGDFLTRV